MLYKNRFSFKYYILCIFRWVAFRNVFCGLKQHQQFFHTSLYIFLPDSPPRLLCEASLCTQLQDQANLLHYPSEQECSAALENCQRKEDKKQWSKQDMEEESVAQNQQKYQCRAAEHGLPSTNQIKTALQWLLRNGNHPHPMLFIHTNPPPLIWVHFVMPPNRITFQRTCSNSAVFLQAVWLGKSNTVGFLCPLKVKL